jgi:amino acid adenylation domain-containing protein
MTHSFSLGISEPPAIDETVEQSSIVALFQRQAVLRPSAPALEVNERSLTYQALDARSNRIARQLTGLGVQPNEVVGICLKRSENLIVGILAVLKAGAAYLPLNPEDPPMRLGWILARAEARFTLTDWDSKSHLPEGASQLLVLDRQSNLLEERESDDATELPKPTDLAYVIFTSGTTGTPKGVAITHGALLNVVTDVAQRVGFNEDSSWLAITTVSFDIAGLELLLPLTYGGKVILASEEQARIGRILAGIIQRKRPTVVQATPITWRILLESGWAGSSDLTVLCGGDRLDRDLANKLIARVGTVWNMYGPTETTIWSTSERLVSGEDAVTLGRPIANTEVYILDQDGRLQESGEIGEICIGGAGVARGYFNDPQLTSRYFFDAHLRGRGTVRLYRTGDLGRWNDRGKLEFYGRLDHQVKINGFRVELAEIEKVLQRCPGVKDAAVLGVGVTNHQKRLYAFLVSHLGIEITVTHLVTHLGQYLPKYMIPEKFWLLDGLPSTPHGKRDVVGLEALAAVQPDLAS